MKRNADPEIMSMIHHKTVKGQIYQIQLYLTVPCVHNPLIYKKNEHICLCSNTATQHKTQKYMRILRQLSRRDISTILKEKTNTNCGHNIEHAFIK